jgi:hypothetical protein
MKTTKLAIILALASMTSVWAVDPTPTVAAAFFLEAGYMPSDQYRINSVFADTPHFYTNFDARITLAGALFVGGGMMCHFIADPNATISFFPYTMDFRFYAGLRLGGFELGFRHNCYHPLTVWGATLSTNDAANEQFYIRFSADVDLFK